MEPDERVNPDEIRDRAYDLWDRHHRPDGFELQFWFMAERELRAERKDNLKRNVERDEPPSEEVDGLRVLQRAVGQEVACPCADRSRLQADGYEVG